MKIKLLLRFLTFISFIITFGLGMVLYLSTNQLNKEIEQNRKINTIMERMTNLGTLTYEYSQDHFDRPREQWKSIIQKTNKLVSRLRETNFKALIRSYQSDLNNIDLLFNELVILYNKRPGLDQEHLNLSQEFEDRLMSQLHLGINNSFSKMIKLDKNSEEAILRFQDRAQFILILFLILLLVNIFFISFLLSKKIVDPLSKLQEATKSFGTGEPNVEINIDAKDEIGDLARTFDNMIKKRKLAETSLRESEEKFHKLFSTNPDSILLMEADTRKILGVNQAAIEKYGYTQEEFLNLTGLDVSADQEETIRSMDKINLGEITYVPLQYHRKKDGTVFPLEVTGGAFTLNKKRLVFGIIRDITERKRAEEQLKFYAGELKRSNKDLEEFAYIASHDLQEPLRKIIMFGDRLKKKCLNEIGDGLTYLERMQKSALRMQKFITSLLEFSRVKTKTNPFKPYDLEQTIKEVIVELELMIYKTKGKIIVESMPTIEVDSAQIQRVFQNLISNALKYHRDGVPPIVNLKSSRQDGTGNWEFRVEDNGIGFDEKYVQRIFKPFERLVGQSAFEGTGIGLAICEKIIHRHGGTITAKSKIGEGSTFIITLPENRAPSV